MYITFIIFVTCVHVHDADYDSAKKNLILNYFFMKTVLLVVTLIYDTCTVVGNNGYSVMMTLLLISK
jgi:hypothetical protein